MAYDREIPREYRKDAQKILKSDYDLARAPRTTIKRTRVGKSDKVKERGGIEKECTSLCSTLVSARDGCCVACGNTQGLMAAHILPKGTYKKLRFDLYNLMAMDFKCHLGNDGWHKNPLKWRAWFDAKYPGKYAELLVMEAAAKKPDLKELVICLRDEVRKMQAVRE
jgi:5-methylcytosine-specific restriction endonuclease McrA